MVIVNMFLQIFTILGTLKDEVLYPNSLEHVLFVSQDGGIQGVKMGAVESENLLKVSREFS